jgi:hypothetical protein
MHFYNKHNVHDVLHDFGSSRRGSSRRSFFHHTVSRARYPSRGIEDPKTGLPEDPEDLGNDIYICSSPACVSPAQVTKAVAKELQLITNMHAQSCVVRGPYAGPHVNLIQDC